MHPSLAYLMFVSPGRYEFSSKLDCAQAAEESRTLLSSSSVDRSSSFSHRLATCQMTPQVTISLAKSDAAMTNCDGMDGQLSTLGRWIKANETRNGVSDLGRIRNG